MRPLFLIAAAAVLVVPSGSAQTISTDRPDFGVGTSVLPRGTLQFESGVRRARTDGLNADQVLESLVRFGLAEPVELRFSWAGLQRQDLPGDRSASGAGDIAVGAKLALGEGRGLLPETSVVAAMSLPSGEAPFTAGETVPDLRAALAWSLGERLGLTVNLGALWNPSPTGRERIEFYSGTLSRASYAGHAVFLEAFGLMLSGDVDDAHHIGVGYLYLLQDTIQLDVYIGTGIGQTAPDGYVGAGIALRLPR